MSEQQDNFRGWPARPAPPLAPENPELVIRDDLLARHAQGKAAILATLRAGLVKVYQERLAAQGWFLAYVTADDARVLLAAMPDLPEQLNRNFLGALFVAPGWKGTGMCVRSRTPGSHGNRILCWRWVPETEGSKAL